MGRDDDGAATLAEHAVEPLDRCIDLDEFVDPCATLRAGCGAARELDPVGALLGREVGHLAREPASVAEAPRQLRISPLDLR